LIVFEGAREADTPGFVEATEVIEVLRPSVRALFSALGSIATDVDEESHGESLAV